MTSEQISEWQAYDTLDPIGTWRDDFRSAQICSVVDNIAKAMWSKEGEAKYSNPKDFMPDWDRSEQRKESEQEVTQTVEEMKSIMMGLVHRTERLKRKGEK